MNKSSSELVSACWAKTKSWKIGQRRVALDGVDSRFCSSQHVNVLDLASETYSRAAFDPKTAPNTIPIINNITKTDVGIKIRFLDHHLCFGGSDPISAFGCRSLAAYAGGASFGYISLLVLILH